jgi:endonuclease YncB( thermonuclease family)
MGKIKTAAIVTAVLAVFFGSAGADEVKRKVVILEVSEVVSVYDGDTFRAKIKGDDSWEPSRSIRLDGIDTPEIRGKCIKEKIMATHAREALKSKLKHAKKITVIVKGAGGFGRPLGAVMADGENVSDWLIASGHARKWIGKRYDDWCTI